MICIHDNTGRIFATNFIELGDVCERLCRLYKRITAALARNMLRGYRLIAPVSYFSISSGKLRADMLWGWADWFYLKLKWKQLLIVRDLFRPPPERLLQQMTDKRQTSTDTYWILTCDTLSHVGWGGWSRKSANRRKQWRREWNPDIWKINRIYLIKTV